ncbi:MAG: hypothetical protein AAFP84_10485, partial [Actinomycetota bacterium]
MPIRPSATTNPPPRPLSHRSVVRRAALSAMAVLVGIATPGMVLARDPATEPVTGEPADQAPATPDPGDGEPPADDPPTDDTTTTTSTT